MIACEQLDQLERAREAFPDEPILCIETCTVHMPSGAVARVSPRRAERALASEDCPVFEPG